MNRRMLTPVLSLLAAGATACAFPTDLQSSEAPDFLSLDRVERAVFADPDFRERFARSFAAETDIEPTLTSGEIKIMQELYEYLDEDRLDEGIEFLTEERNEASSPVFDYQLGNLYFRQDELEQAVASYERAIRAFPKYRQAWQNLASIHMQELDYQQAVRALTQVISLGGHDHINYGLLGMAHLNLGNHLPAESAFRMANLLDHETIEWKQGLGAALYQQGQFPAAVALYGQLIRENPDNIDFWVAQSYALVESGQPMRAAQNFEIIESMGLSTADTLNMLADIYVNEGLYELAVPSYIRALEIEPDSSVRRSVAAARLISQRGAPDGTVVLINSIESMRGDQLTEDDRKDLLKIKARLAVALGDTEGNLAVLEELVALDPLDGDALIMLGQQASNQGDQDKAIFWFERAQSLEAFEATASRAHAQVLVQMGKYAQALPLLRRSQKIDYRESVQEFLEQIERRAKKG
jgi:tetratricopeptide (TPR) repeat protein